MEKTALQREICFCPAFDRRDPDPKKNYGIHGVSMQWFLTGPEGCIQFVVYTNWHLPHVMDETWEKHAHDTRTLRILTKPMAADIGYHSYIPRHEGQEPLQNECEHLGGAPCYYDGSSLNAEKGFELLVTEGDEAVWNWMEDYYKEWLT